MGTSHRHKPTGSPNWGKASKSITQISKDIGEANDLLDNPPQNISQHKIAKRQSILEDRISRSYHSAVRNIIRAAGGRNSVAKGTSRVIGHSEYIMLLLLHLHFKKLPNKGLAHGFTTRALLQ